MGSFCHTDLSAMLDGLSPMGTNIPPQRDVENTCAKANTVFLSVSIRSSRKLVLLCMSLNALGMHSRANSGAMRTRGGKVEELSQRLL